MLFFPGRHGEGIVTAMCDTGLSQSTSAGCKLLVKSGAGSKFCFAVDDPWRFLGCYESAPNQAGHKERYISELL